MKTYEKSCRILVRKKPDTPEFTMKKRIERPCSFLENGRTRHSKEPNEKSLQNVLHSKFIHQDNTYTFELENFNNRKVKILQFVDDICVYTNSKEIVNYHNKLPWRQLKQDQ